MANPLLSAEGLLKLFGSDPAAEDISLAVEAGMVHAVIGAAKSGKSTIVGLLAGTLQPDKGTIQFRGSAIENKPAGERVRMGIALVAGSAGFFPDETVLDNVRIAREAVLRQAGTIFSRNGEAVELAAWRALVAANLKTRAHLRASSLSFIDGRWLEIAMALVCEPEVLLFDEPFAGASAGEILELRDFLQGLKRKHAIFLTDRSAGRVSSFADRISFLARGRIVTGPLSPGAGHAVSGGGVGNA